MTSSDRKTPPRKTPQRAISLSEELQEKVSGVAAWLHSEGWQAKVNFSEAIQYVLNQAFASGLVSPNGPRPGEAPDYRSLLARIEKLESSSKSGKGDS